MNINKVDKSTFGGLYISPLQEKNLYKKIDENKYRDGILDVVDVLKNNPDSHVRVTDEGDVFLSHHGNGGHFDFYDNVFDNFFASLKMIYYHFDNNKD